MTMVVSRRCNFRCFIAALAVSLVGVQASLGQVVQQAVGGISIDAEGAVTAPSRLDQEKLQAVRQSAIAAAPKDLQAWTDLRAVSLKAIEATIAEKRKTGNPLPEEVRYLAGLQRVEYVLVYPEQNDVVLAGPAEGWRMDELGNVVGLTSGRPVLLLDDLVVALRTRDVPQLEAISCSIDPTAEGMQRLRAMMSRQRTIGDPQTTTERMTQALGPQTVSVTGVPATSHFARAMVAADFRMKRLAMNFEEAPIGDMPSFLDLLKSSRAHANMTPRWWLAANYEPIARDAEGLAWQLRGQGVQCMTEQDHFSASGERQRTGKTNPMAVRWAKTFTERFEDLADRDSAFGVLRNVMDLAVVAALIDHHRLLDRAELSLPGLLHECKIANYPVPKHVASQTTFVKRRGDYLISTSGGVQLLPWEIVKNVTTSSEPSAVHRQMTMDGKPGLTWYPR